MQDGAVVSHRVDVAGGGAPDRVQVLSVPLDVAEIAVPELAELKMEPPAPTMMSVVPPPEVATRVWVAPVPVTAAQEVPLVLLRIGRWRPLRRYWCPRSPTHPSGPEYWC